MTVLLYTCVCNCRVSMSLVLYVRLPLILAAKLVGLFLHHCIKKKDFSSTAYRDRSAAWLTDAARAPVIHVYHYL